MERKSRKDASLLRLGYQAPFAFELMLAFLSRRLLPGIERIRNNGYERVLGPINNSTWIRVTDVPEKAELRLEISRTDPHQIPNIVSRVRRLFDLDADLEAAHAVLATDSLLATGIERRPGLRIPGGWDGFEILVRAIIGQQVSVPAATTLVRRLVQQYGEDRKNATGELNRAFPTAERIADATMESIGLPKTRVLTLRAVATAILNGQLNFDCSQPLEEFVARMIELPGIGRWTAHYVAMRALNYPDAFPAGDLVVQRALGNGNRLSERETEARSQAWRPWRAYAVLHLWHLAAERK
jgi:AraC family transcriptional regulator of adaptative response / DNA-3-methyladenine glycosylase II